jgi:hypothetical protein
MLEQDLASIMRFLAEKSGSPAPYYNNVPEQFRIPAVYFPRPEIGSSGDTLNTYALDFSLFVKFFHRTKEDAYELGYTALNALLERRNRIPLIDESGKPTGKYIRIRDPTLRAVDESAVQLQIDWTARKPFADAPEKMMQTYEIETQIKRSYDAAKAEQEVLYGIQSNH